MDNKGIELLKELLAELTIRIKELGPCHSNNVRICEWKTLIEKTESYLTSLEKGGIGDTHKIELTSSEAWDKIIGNEHVKRAIEVSLAGQHPITVIGDPDNGEEYLERILGDLLTFLPPCPCGNFMNPNKGCYCTVSQTKKYTGSKKYQTALKNPIIVQLHPPTSRDYQIKSKGESFKDVLNRITLVDFDKKLEMEATNLLSTAIQRLNFTAKQVENIKDVANTIALLDSSEIIKTYHLAEAISYLRY